MVSEQGRELHSCVDYMKVRFLALCSCGLPVEEARGVRAGEGVAQDRLLIT